MRKDSFAAIGSQSGLKSYSAVGGVLDSIRKRLASDQELSERCPANPKKSNILVKRRLDPFLKDSFAAIGSQFGLKSYSAVGGVLDSIRKRLASDQELSERFRQIQKTIT